MSFSKLFHKSAHLINLVTEFLHLRGRSKKCDLVVQITDASSLYSQCRLYTLIPAQMLHCRVQQLSLKIDSLHIDL